MIKTIRVISNFKQFVQNLTGPITEDQKNLICNHLASYERGECYCLVSVHQYIDYCLAVVGDQVGLYYYLLIEQAFNSLFGLVDEDLYLSNDDEEIWCN